MFGSLGSLGLSGGASSGSDAGAGSSQGTSSGNWNVNLGGSGVAFQSGTGSILMIAAVALVAVWLLKK